MARSRGRTIDYKQWERIAQSIASVSTATTTLLGTLLIAQPQTILRSRGFVQAAFDATQQVGDTMTLTFGLGVVSMDAAAAGAGSVPDPNGDPEYPWLWWG